MAARVIDLKDAINAVSDLGQNRPRPLRNFDQIYMKAGDMVLQSELVALWANRGALTAYTRQQVQRRAWTSRSTTLEVIASDQRSARRVRGRVRSQDWNRLLTMRDSLFCMYIVQTAELR